MLSLTRDELSNLKELDLQKKVLVPLFKAMGFRGVTVWGGGSGELGKDIVMWKIGDLGRRFNYGVVVKADKISGKAAPVKSSASEVHFQITQCFANPYLEIASTEERPIHRCWVVSSKEINKEAITAIRGQLRSSGLDRDTDFIDGDQLWDLVREYLPELGVFDQLDAVQKKLDEIAKSNHYRIVANTKGQFYIETKYPGAEKDEPLQVSGAFQFDRNDPMGDKAWEDWQHHIKTGAPLTIASPQLQELKLPEFLDRLINPSGDMILTIGPARNDVKVLLKFMVHGRNGEAATLDYLEFETVQVGTEEVTLSNSQQPVPWKVTLIINIATRRWKITFSFPEENLNVTQALQAIRLQQALAGGGEIKILNLINGFEFPTVRFDPMAITVDERWAKLLEELVFIQKKTTVLLTVPSRNIDRDEAVRILVTADILRTGRARLEGSEWPVNSPVSKAKEAAQAFAEESVHHITMNDRTGHVMNVLDTEIPLGPAVLFCDNVFMPQQTLDGLKRDIEKAANDSVVSYRLALRSPIEARFLNWLPENEVAELHKLPIWNVDGAED